MNTDGLLELILPGLNRGDCPDGSWPDRNGCYWPLSPLRVDQHSGSFKVGPLGFWDFASKDKGSLKALAEHMGLELPKRRAEKPTGCTLAGYAESKRLDADLLRSYGLRDGQWYGLPCVFMPYRDQGGHETAVRVRKELRKPVTGKDTRFCWPRGAKLSLYGLWRLCDMRKAGWVLLCEGESDCHTGWQYGLPCLGVPGATNWNPAWAECLAGLAVFVWREPDVGGSTFARDVTATLPDALIITPPEGRKDLSECHVLGDDVPALVEQLRAEAKPAAQPDGETLEGLAPWVREQLGHRCGRDQKLGVGSRIAEWLLARGRLLLDVGQDTEQGGRPYVRGDDGALWPLGPDSVATRRLLHAAGLNGTEIAYRFICEELVMAAFERGERVRLVRWQHGRDGALHVSSGPCELVRANGGQLELLPNGTDGVWFAGDAAYPAWRPTTAVDPFALAAFRPNLAMPLEAPAYTPQVQRLLLGTYFAALVSGVRPLPVLIALGPKGGGKTRLCAALLHALLGPTADVAPLSADKRDFSTLVTSRPLAALDNVDTDLPPWFMDQLAITVTGGNVESRVLYTDGDVLTRPITAAVAVTTRTASFARPDVAERSLPLLTREFDDAQRRADSALMAEVDAQRDGLLSWATLTGAELLAARTQAPDGLPLRFIDFARLVWAYCRQRPNRPDATAALVALRQAQSLTVGEADELIEAIATHFSDIATDGAWRGTPKELVAALESVGAELSFLGGGKAIARRLREGRATLQLLAIRLTERSCGNATQFELMSTGESGNAENPSRSSAQQ